MRALLQRVQSCQVSVEGCIISSIQAGLCIFLGIWQHDNEHDVQWLARKVSSLRIFADEKGKMSKNIQEVNGELLVISQFTLYCDCHSAGRRPDCTQAAAGKEAEFWYRSFITELTHATGITPQTGSFGSHMSVGLINDGPVTLFIDSRMK